MLDRTEEEEKGVEAMDEYQTDDLVLRPPMFTLNVTNYERE